jgi:hypothetical protein
MTPCAEHRTLVFTHQTPSRKVWKSYPCSAAFQSKWGTSMGNCYVCTNWQSTCLHKFSPSANVRSVARH